MNALLANLQKIEGEISEWADLSTDDNTRTDLRNIAYMNILYIFLKMRWVILSSA